MKLEGDYLYQGDASVVCESAKKGALQKMRFKKIKMQKEMKNLVAFKASKFLKDKDEQFACSLDTIQKNLNFKPTKNDILV